MEEFIPFVFFSICIFIYQGAVMQNFRGGMKTEMKKKTKTEVAASYLHTL